LRKLRRFLPFAQNRAEIVVLWWKLKGSRSMKEGLNHRESGSSSAERQTCGQGGAGSFYFSDALLVSRIQPRKKSSTLREEGPADGSHVFNDPEGNSPGENGGAFPEIELL
jgi:hypothetical protein